ncbi:hypothetical protein LTR29_008147 [Friedmanniomyces endolithicus]|nr:hypothetical protein LTR29_008147 [Friedmanniomyces endolithicus]
MEAPDTFLQLPLTIDPATKAISSTDSTLSADLDDLNKLHRTLLALETPQQTPPPPAPVHPKRSVQINKLRESGNASYKKGDFSGAITLYNLAMRMASERPSWEASGLVHMAQQNWAEGSVDAECSVELKRVGNLKGWWRRGVCLKEMGRTEEAADWVKTGLEFERVGPEKDKVTELEGLLKEVNKGLEKP